MLLLCSSRSAIYPSSHPVGKAFGLRIILDPCSAGRQRPPKRGVGFVTATGAGSGDRDRVRDRDRVDRDRYRDGGPGRWGQ